MSTTGRRLLRALTAGDRAKDTIVVFTGDHGEMMGERGLWYKMTFFEWPRGCRCCSTRPAASRRGARRATSRCRPRADPARSGLRRPPAEPIDPLDGHSLAPLLADGAAPWDDLVAGEYLAEGALAPLLMVKRGSASWSSARRPRPALRPGERSAELANRAGDPPWPRSRPTSGARSSAAGCRGAEAAGHRQPAPPPVPAADPDRRPPRRLGLPAGQGRAKSYVRNIGMDEDTVKGRARPALRAAGPAGSVSGGQKGAVMPAGGGLTKAGYDHGS